MSEHSWAGGIPSLCTGFLLGCSKQMISLLEKFIFTFLHIHTATESRRGAECGKMVQKQWLVYCSGCFYCGSVELRSVLFDETFSNQAKIVPSRRCIDFYDQPQIILLYPRELQHFVFVMKGKLKKAYKRGLDFYLFLIILFPLFA